MSYRRYIEKIKEREINNIYNEINNNIVNKLRDELPVKTGRLRRSIRLGKLRRDENGAIYAEGYPGIYGYINKEVRYKFNKIIHDNRYKIYFNLNNREVK